MPILQSILPLFLLRKTTEWREKQQTDAIDSNEV